MPVHDDSDPESVYEAAQQPFQPFDPESVQPTSPRPAPESTTPDFGGPSGEDGDAAAPPVEQQEEEAPLPQFDPRYVEAFSGLMYLGRLEDSFEMWGHKFRIRTLTTEELAEIGLYMKQYEGTRSQNAVYQSAVVGTAVITLDGRPLPQSLSPADSGITFRTEWVMENWMPAVRERIWDKVFALEEKVREVLDAMGKASG